MSMPMSSLLNLGHKYRCEWFHILTSWFRNPKKRKVTFSEDETAVVEIEEDGPAYGAADTGSPAPAAAGQEEEDTGSSGAGHCSQTGVAKNSAIPNVHNCM